MSSFLTSFLFCRLLVCEKAVIVKKPALEIATVPLFAGRMMLTTQDSTMSKTAGISTIMQLNTVKIFIQRRDMYIKYYRVFLSNQPCSLKLLQDGAGL